MALLVAAGAFVVPTSAQRHTEGVTPIPAEGLILKSANYFDLEGKSLTFTPNSSGGYAVAVGDLTWEDPGAGATSQIVDRWSEEQLAVDLPFRFPFAGRTWTRVYANWTGNISFQRPEPGNWRDRDPWSNGTMRSVAAAIDSRSAAGVEVMIAALWAPYGGPTISVDSTPARVVVTWWGVRPTPTAEWHFPLGDNLFQARLYPSGVIELVYRAVAERDGFVGLFHGLGGSGRLLDTADDAVGDVAEPVLDITGVEILENGSTLLARVTLAEDVPQRVADGEIVYRIGLDFSSYDCTMGVSVTTSGRKPWGRCGPSPGVGGYRVSGATIEVPISKTLLFGADRLTWNADAVWWGRAFDQVFEDRTVPVGGTDRDLGATGHSVNGNVFEVFHYPVLPKDPSKLTPFVYERSPANDEFAVLFTDFRIDDLFSQGPGSGPINEPVHGIGPWQADPTPGERYGSDNLLVTASPMFVGAPLWAETGVAKDRAFRNFSRGIAWIAHEVTHRWVAHMQFRNPRSGRVENLAGDGVHWSEWLHVPAVHPMWPRYASEPYNGQSINGGSVWSDNGDGTFTRVNNGLWLVTTGLSALDLYAMGLIPPDEVPDTYLLEAAEGVNPWGTIRATKVPVRIEDIVAVMGPRLPAADRSRKEFRLGAYLLHDGRTPRPNLLEHARRVVAEVPEYFSRASDGRMRVVLNGGSAPEPDPPPGDGACEAGDETLCLQNGRFEVKADWWTTDSRPATAFVVPKRTDDSGLFYFFGSENWEILIKVLDGCGVNGHVWVYGASTTDLGYLIRVRDTVTGAVSEYRNEAGEAASAITDNKAFPAACGERGLTTASTDHEAEGRLPHLSQARSPLVSAESGSGCTESGTALCLADERFEVTVDWSTVDGTRGGGGAVPGTNNSGLFYFFGSENWEMLIKVLDGCGVNGHHWVYAAAATDLGLDIQVTDTATGAEWTYSKEPGEPAPAITANDAFGDTCRP